MIELNRVEVAQDALRVDYRVTNPDDSPIYLFDLFWTVAEKGFTLLPDESYRFFDGDTLVLQRAVQPMPPGMRLEEPETPYASRVETGETAERSIVLPVPVARFTAYGGPVTPGEHVGTPARLVLSLGYVRRSDILDGWAVITPKPKLGEGTFAPDAGLALELQRSFEAELPVPEGLTGYLDQ